MLIWKRDGMLKAQDSRMAYKSPSPGIHYLHKVGELHRGSLRGTKCRTASCLLVQGSLDC